MRTYPRLNLENDDEAKTWVSLAHEYWRRIFRDCYGRGFEQEARETVDDVVKYCQQYPDVATVDCVFPESLVLFTSGDPAHLNNVVPWLDSMVRTGAAPVSLGMLSNWVTLLEYAAAPAQLKSWSGQLKNTVEYLTSQEPVHRWDNALVYMAVKTAEMSNSPKRLKDLARACAKDTNPERAASRLMTVMEHTASGALWWETLNGHHNGAKGVALPALPNAKETVKRKERSEQAWWRYTHEMHATKEFEWVHAWTTSLMSPSRDMTFTTNGLL